MKPIIIFLVYIAILSVLLLPFTRPGGAPDLFPLIYGNGGIEWFLIMAVFWPIAALIFGILFNLLLIPIFLLFYKKTIGINMIYGIQEVPKSKKFKKTFQGFFPSLMAINFSSMLTSNEELIKLVINKSNHPDTIIVLLALLILSIPTIGVAMALFAPVWSLLDAGIMYSNKDKITKKNVEAPLEGRTLGGWYMHLLKGYAGISTIISYYSLTLIFFNGIMNVSGSVSFENWIRILLSSFIFFPLMFLITFATIPTIILLDVTRMSRIKYVKTWANKIGITKNVKIIFQEID